MERPARCCTSSHQGTGRSRTRSRGQAERQPCRQGTWWEQRSRRDSTSAAGSQAGRRMQLCCTACQRGTHLHTESWPGLPDQQSRGGRDHTRTGNRPQLAPEAATVYGGQAELALLASRKAGQWVVAADMRRRQRLLHSRCFASTRPPSQDSARRFLGSCRLGGDHDPLCSWFGKFLHLTGLHGRSRHNDCGMAFKHTTRRPTQTSM